MIKYTLQELVEKKNTLKHSELNVDRDESKGVVETVVQVEN